jgi:hypothetical protein
MNKVIVILSFFIVFGKIGYGQFLHIGAKGFISPFIIMNFYEYPVTDYVYYFSNDKNETVRFSGFEFSQIKSVRPSPDVFVRYDLGNSFYVQADLFHMKFSNEAKYKNSVDYQDFVSEFNPDGTNENLEYNSINLNWKFWGNSFIVGYKMLKAKAFRPDISFGINVLYLSQFEHHTILEKAEAELDSSSTGKFRHYNEIIFYNLDTFKPVTLYSYFGIGFKYHALSLDLFWTASFPNSDMDIYADNYNSSTGYRGDITLSQRANYQSMNTFNASIGINLMSFNLTKKYLEF